MRRCYLESYVRINSLVIYFFLGTVYESKYVFMTGLHTLVNHIKDHITQINLQEYKKIKPVSMVRNNQYLRS